MVDVAARLVLGKDEDDLDRGDGLLFVELPDAQLVQARYSRQAFELRSDTLDAEGRWSALQEDHAGAVG